MRFTPRRAAIAPAAVIAGAIAATVAVTACGSSGGSTTGATATGGSASGGASHAAAPGQTPGAASLGPGRAAFSWFRAQPTPAGWRQTALPGGGAVLSYPQSLRPMPGDKGTLSEGLSTSGKVLIYLNVTPRQGDETLAGWADFRVEHLTDDDASSARLDDTARLAFRGGPGSCVIDDYVTKVHANHYREIACYVQGAHASSVLVAATPTADWARYAGVLEEAVSAFAVK